MGSVLILVPAAVLVLVILGAIAVDSAVVFMGQRELDNYTASAATSAAAAGLDPGTFYANGAVTINAKQAQEIAQRLRKGISGGVHDVQIDVVVDGNQVSVTATGLVDDLFGAGLPGAHRARTVRAVSRATARPLTPP